MSSERSHQISIRIDQKLSRLSNTSNTCNEYCVLKVHDKLRSHNEQNKHCIFKVHDELRSHNKKAYEPRVLSIGPYHYDKCNLRKMEMFKLRYLQGLLFRTEKTVEEYIIALIELEDHARRCYDENIQPKEDEFVEMMCLDGCFVIELLREYRKHTSRRNDSAFQKGWLVNSFFRDLLLIENQIPFFILKKLYEMTKIPDEEDDIIQLGLRLCYLMKGFRPRNNYANTISADEVSHLLDLVHKGWCSPFAATISKSNDPVNDWPLECIKSTTELRKSGVKIRSAKEYKSWLHITFKDGIIEVPTLTVDDFTESILRNLIVYELYMSKPNSRSYVTDYVKFLDLLIDSPRDVEQLRIHGIIVNLLGDWLGDDEPVSTMFNKLLRDITVNDWMFCYSRVFKEVNEYSSSRRNKWKACCAIWVEQLMENHFSSPWSIISFLAAVALLILTVVQTIFSILAVGKN